MRRNVPHSPRFPSLVAGRQRVFERVVVCYTPPETGPCNGVELRDDGCPQVSYGGFLKTGLRTCGQPIEGAIDVSISSNNRRRGGEGTTA